MKAKIQLTFFFEKSKHIFTDDASKCIKSTQEILKRRKLLKLITLNFLKILTSDHENIPRKKLQKNIHCLAKKGGLNKFIEYPNQGLKIYNQSKNMHSKIYSNTGG